MTGWLNGWDGAGGLTLCHIAALTGGGLPGLGPFQLLSRDGGDWEGEVARCSRLVSMLGLDGNIVRLRSINLQ